MSNWVIGFTPETYTVVKRKSMIGVRKDVWKRFSDEMRVGDKFIGYISKLVIFDSIGTIQSDATFEEDFAFHPDKWYPGRRKVSFEKVGLAVQARDLFMGIQPFNEINTVPGNYIMCKGGFVKISATDFNWLLGKIEKK